MLWYNYNDETESKLKALKERVKNIKEQ
jgi:hypothetical protein